MAKYDSSNIRNVVVLGHQSSGKTSLVDSLNFISGNVSVRGYVDKKTSASDYLSEEQARGGSIQTAVIPMIYKDTKINFIDVPGNDDFVAESIGVSTVVKGAILVIDAQTGVQVGTVKHYNMLRRKGIPTFIFVNKMDKDDVKFDDVFAQIEEKIGKSAIPFTYPLGHAAGFDGFVNVISKNVVKFVNGKPEPAEVNDDKKAKVMELRNQIVETVATTSDELLEKYFGGEELSEEEIKGALRVAFLNTDILPVLVGSAANGVGILTLLDMIIDYMPKPSELKALEATDENGNQIERKTLVEEPFSAYVFKTIVDPYTGVIALIKVNSGVLKAGDDVYANGETQRVSMLYQMNGKNLNQVNEVYAGDIAAITRLEKIPTGSTLCSPKSIIKYKPVKLPTAVIFKGAVLKNKNDEAKLGPALAKIQLEDPCVEVKRNNETKQLLIGGVSDSHINFIINKLKTIYKIELTTEPMKVVYRESIKSVAEAEGRYVKQSGGSGFYGVVKMRFEPTEESAFAEEVFGGAVPKNYFPAVEKGFFEALKSGLLAGFPVIGVKGVLIDGKYHPVDSNEQAFRMAAILAFKEAYAKCKPIILEPIMRIKVNIESRYTGDVLSDLNTRRAKVQNIEEGEHGVQIIEALVPEAEIVDYVTQLKSITQASGYFNREFEDYEEVPSYLVDKVIKENKISE